MQHAANSILQIVYGLLKNMFQSPAFHKIEFSNAFWSQLKVFRFVWSVTGKFELNGR